MATWKSFEDINAWRVARELNIDVYIIVKRLRNSGEYERANQIVRSAGSIIDNIAEGYERDGTKEFKQFVSYSKDSAGELKAQIIRAHDLKLIDTSVYEQLQLKITEEQATRKLKP